MSRWKDQFENHAIHEAFKQAREWLSVEFEEIDSEHEVERRRLFKVLDLMGTVVDGMDPEFFPEAQLAALNNHLRHQNFWNQLSNYSSSGNVQNLRTANDHLNSQVPAVYQMAGLSKSPESRKVINGVEKAFDEFCEAIESKETEFSETANKMANEISALQSRTGDLSASLDTLTTDTVSQLSAWQNEFTEAQTTRVQEHSDAQIERDKEYDEALREFKTTADTDRMDTTNKHDKALKTVFDVYSEDVKNKTTDINEKHKSILEIHGLVTKDGVAGGYKKGADEEKKAASNWSMVSMGCYVVILFWALFKGRLGFGIADLDGIDWAVVVTTVSVTGVAFVAAQFAGRQSRVHRMNEQKMRWFSFEIAAIDPFISSLPVEMQQSLKKELSERLFGQDRVIDDRAGKTHGIDPDMFKSMTNSIIEAIKTIRK